MPGTPRPLHISLVAIPDAVISTLTGIYDVLGAFRMLGRLESSIPESPPFTVEIVAAERGKVALASGVPVEVHRAVSDIAATDIIIVPSILLEPDGWTPGRYPEIVDWARRMHTDGALLCSACSGVFLLAETGLFDGREATVHWGYADGEHPSNGAGPYHGAVDHRLCRSGCTARGAEGSRSVLCRGAASLPATNLAGPRHSLPGLLQEPSGIPIVLLSLTLE